MSMFTGATGEVSSKRIVGTGMIVLGAILSGVLFYRSLGSVVGDPDTSMKIINALFFTGGTLIGAGVIELFGKVKKEDKIE